MTNHQEIYKDVELWESRQLGAEEEFVKKSDNENAINELIRETLKASEQHQL